MINSNNLVTRKSLRSSNSVINPKNLISNNEEVKVVLSKNDKKN